MDRKNNKNSARMLIKEKDQARNHDNDNDNNKDNEEKVKLVQPEEQARNGGIGLMETLKRAQDVCYPEFRHLTMQCLSMSKGGR